MRDLTNNDMRTFLYQNQMESCHLEYSNITLFDWWMLSAELQMNCPLSSGERIYFQVKSVRKFSLVSKPPYKRETFSWQRLV